MIKRLCLSLVLSGLFFAPAAGAQTVTSVLGVPCSTQGDGVQYCQGNIEHRIPSWDSVPLDTDVWLPPADQNGPFPLIVWLHGWGEEKSITLPSSLMDQVHNGYAVLSYSARGWGASCGTAASQLTPGCATGWIHLADTRYEVRDTQYIAGRLADLGLVEPRKIGVTGHSYGAGQSYMLATLKDRIMRSAGRLAPWRSPEGKPMAIAAAVPEFGWTDLAYALMPNGRTLDFRASNPYGPRVGIAKQSWLTSLYDIGLADGHYAPPGADPQADITNWYLQVEQGEPYDSNPATKALLRKIKRYHSPYYLQQGLPPAERQTPAPILAYNAWTDDIFPADEGIRYYNAVHSQFPAAEFSLLLADGQGHPRASLTATTPGLNRLRNAFFDRLLKGAPGKPLRVRTYTQGCGQPVAGPFNTKTWAQQHPGEVAFGDPQRKTIDSNGGDPATAAAVDPFAGGSCRTTPAVDDTGAATYRLPAAAGSGYTLLGSPRVSARIRPSDVEQAQVAARLWDVAPDGNQDFVTRALYRPDAFGRQVFQLHPNGWHFAAGHVPKLELLGRDSPYARPSNGSFSVDISKLTLTLPTHEPCPVVRNGGPGNDLIRGHASGERMRGGAGNDVLIGRRGGDCLIGDAGIDIEFGGLGADRLSGGGSRDALVGGRGRDVIMGGPGRDVIISLDLRRDVVRCGSGRDRIVADSRDRLVGCELRLNLRTGKFVPVR